MNQQRRRHILIRYLIYIIPSYRGFESDDELAKILIRRAAEIKIPTDGLRDSIAMLIINLRCDDISSGQLGSYVPNERDEKIALSCTQHYLIKNLHYFVGSNQTAFRRAMGNFIAKTLSRFGDYDIGFNETMELFQEILGEIMDQRISHICRPKYCAEK